MNRKNKNKKAFSILELTVGLGVLSIIIIILFNAIIISLKVSVENSAKSQVREELTKTLSLLARDIRAIDEVTECPTTDGNGISSCNFRSGNTSFSWVLCEENRICKSENDQITYKTSESVNITTFDIQEGFVDSVSQARTNIVITIVGSYQGANIDIGSIVRQTSVSTRNYNY